MANATYGAHTGTTGDAGNSTAYVNVFGAIISLTLLLGVVIWAAQTLMRDASGVPVVQALDGPMRVAPGDPGGVPAAHQGLTVNTVAGSQAAIVNPELQLAPQPVALQDEDQPTGALNVQGGQNVDVVSFDSTNSGTPQSDLTELEALAAQLAAAAQPSATLDQSATVTNASLPVTEFSRSMRPQMRPLAIRSTANTVVAAPAVATPTAIAPTPTAAPTIIAPGTRMAQLGAYESDAIAQREWQRLSSRFDNYLGGKPHVIQTAESGGKTFYRLRVHGFQDAADARRFCAALIAQNAGCYPVKMR